MCVGGVVAPRPENRSIRVGSSEWAVAPSVWMGSEAAGGGGRGPRAPGDLGQPVGRTSGQAPLRRRRETWVRGTEAAVGGGLPEPRAGCSRAAGGQARALRAKGTMPFTPRATGRPREVFQQVGAEWFVAPEACSICTFVRGSGGPSWERSTWRPLWQSGRDSGDLGDSIR